jgi:ABC-type dipeptide/oligopeptide/nickel transport system permease component
VALPGSGSLLAGRVSGYAQMALAVGGMLISVVFGVPAFVWGLRNWSRLRDPYGDPFAMLGEILWKFRWALLGLGVFAVGWLWGLVSGLGIVHAAKRAEAANKPPVLG